TSRTTHSPFIPWSSSTYMVPFSRYLSIMFSCSSANSSNGRYCFLLSFTSVIFIPHGSLSTAQNFLQLLSFRQLINQLIQIPNISHQRVFDTVKLHPAHRPFDKKTVGIHCRRISKKLSITGFIFLHSLKIIFLISCQPRYNRCHFIRSSALSQRFLFQQKPNPCKGHLVYLFICHISFPCLSVLPRSLLHAV